LRSRILLATWLLLVFFAVSVRPSDHADTSHLKALGRHDARLTDLHVFTRGDRLVLSLCTNPTIPPGTTDYTFPEDLTLRFAIDNDSEVRFDDPMAVAQYGGTIVWPAHVHENVVFEIRFDKKGKPRLYTNGMRGSFGKEISLFAGLRDDPFIRGPRIGKNVAAVVLELPLAAVIGPQPTLLVWATSKIPPIPGPMSELAGRALRSQLNENMALNEVHPNEHTFQFGVPPDVVIFDSSRPCAYPNGRALEDDVMDLVGDPHLLEDDAPYPSANDVPFLEEFPYLAPPQ